MKIQVLGTGCPKCNELYSNAESAAKELELDYEMEKVSEVTDIVAMGVMVTPALAVDGDVKSAGKVLSVEQVKSVLTEG